MATLGELRESTAQLRSLEAQVRQETERRNRLVVELMETEKPMDVAVAAEVTPARLYQMKKRAQKA